MAAICLLLNMVATISISATLEDWSESTNVWLDCEVSESMITRDWPRYDFFGSTSGSAVCDMESVSEFIGSRVCVSDCFWRPAVTTEGMICLTSSETTLDDVQELLGTYEANTNNWNSLFWESLTYCDCPCNDMVSVKRPSVGATALSFVSQALVTTIVGMNLAAKYWKTTWEAHGKKSREHSTGYQRQPSKSKQLLFLYRSSGKI